MTVVWRQEGTKYPLELGFYNAASAGKIPGVIRFATLGNNPAVTSAEEPEDVWNGAELGILNGYNHKLIPFPTAPTTVEVFSSSVNDSSAGTGMRTALVQYLDTNYEHKTAVITMNGTIPVAFPEPVTAINSFIRLTTGTFRGSNIGNVSIRDAGGAGKTYSYMTAGTGFARSSAIVVPAGYSFFLFSLILAVNRVDTNERFASFSLAIMPLPAGGLLRSLEVALGSTVPYRHEAQNMPVAVFPEKNAVWVTCEKISITNTNVTAGYAGLAIKNTDIPVVA